MKRIFAIILAFSLCMTTTLAAVATERQPATTDLVLDNKDTIDIVFVYDNQENLGSSGIEWERHCFKFLDRLMWENEGLGIHTNFIQYRTETVGRLTKDDTLLDYNPDLYEKFVDRCFHPYLTKIDPGYWDLTYALVAAHKILESDDTVKDDHKFIIILTDSSDLNDDEKQIARMKDFWYKLNEQFNTGSVVIFNAKDRETFGDSCQHWFTEYCDHTLELNWKEYNTPISSEDWIKVDDFFDLMFKVVSEVYMNSVNPGAPDEPPTPPTPDEPDVPTPVTPTVAYKDHLAYMVGYNGNFMPYNTMTRAEAVTVLYRLLNPSVRDKYFTSMNSFTDVSTDLWYNKAVSTMANIGYVKGMPDGTFSGMSPVTRAEFVTLMVRFLDKPIVTGDGFVDSTSSWAADYIATAKALGWVSGYTDGTFKPNAPIARCEAVAIINRAFGRSVSADNVKNPTQFNDVAVNDWFYLDVVEATTNHECYGSPERWTSNTVENTYNIQYYEWP